MMSKMVKQGARRSSIWKTCVGRETVWKTRRRADEEHGYSRRDQDVAVACAGRQTDEAGWTVPVTAERQVVYVLAEWNTAGGDSATEWPSKEKPS